MEEKTIKLILRFFDFKDWEISWNKNKNIYMNFDVIVLGSGPGGYVTTIRASQLDHKFLL